MVEVLTPFMLLIGAILGALAAELDLRRNIKRDPTVISFMFGKDVNLIGAIMEICDNCSEHIRFGECNCPDEKEYQWLYKPKAETEWKLSSGTMTQAEADHEFKLLGERWEYKKLKD